MQSCENAWRASLLLSEACNVFGHVTCMRTRMLSSKHLKPVSICSDHSMFYMNCVLWMLVGEITIDLTVGHKCNMTVIVLIKIKGLTRIQSGWKWLIWKWFLKLQTLFPKCNCYGDNKCNNILIVSKINLQHICIVNV